ncbi:MAG: hypothetical protein D6770_10100, partial [Anaerolineae bacterium]
MSRKHIVAALVILTALLVLLLQIPSLQSRLAWRFEIITTYLRGVVHPAGPVPTPLPSPTARVTPTAAYHKKAAPTATAAATPTVTPKPLPPRVALPSPAYEQQDMNNCGPATLTMALRYYGWEGDQFDISDVIKPKRPDRNVNPEELVYYVRNYAGWLRAEYRVNGDLTLLKRLLAAGYPVIIEEVFRFDSPYWPNDDLWAAHYLLVTGYDDATRTVTGQDSFHGPDRQIPYDTLMENWKPFNYVYLLIYLPQEETELQTILGADWNPDVIRQNALTASQAATEVHPEDAFAWFNLGTNLVALERYAEA